ncbi:hypothetical protein [Rhodoferax sp. GW822-FHT02A01]|uniref:hypothetical protein n=1 Tax=Rhodoferax sp. GW822-FHT02A01 TaxID=3141537 RepID=UPI00315D84A1
MLKKKVRKSHQRILAGNPIWRAFAQKPISRQLHTDITLTSLCAFDELVAGSGTRVHASRLYACCNMGLVLSEWGYGAECIEDILAAQASICSCQERALNGFGYSLNPAESGTIREFLGIHQQQTELATEAEIARAFAIVEDQMIFR